jgi:hypothetical protein
VPTHDHQPVSEKAIRDGHLKIVKTHSYRSAGKSEATEFQFFGPPRRKVVPDEKIAGMVGATRGY